MYESILHYNHSIPPSCFDHPCGIPQGGALQGMEDSL